MDFLRRLFTSGGFQPHGYCYQWNSGLVWLNACSDVLIALAYFTIPLTLVWFIRKRRDLPFSWMFALFGVFIVACGTTHAMEVWNLWHAEYWLAGAVKAVTAAVSVATAILMVPLVPKALDLPSHTQWIRANVALQKEVDARRDLEVDLRTSEANFREQADLLELTHDAIFVRSLAGKILYWNRGAEALYGWRKEEARGQISHILLQSEFPQPLTEIEKEALEKGQWEGELTHRRRDGATLIISSRWSLRTDPLGKPLSFLEINRDITERRNEAEKFRKLLEAAPDAMVIANPDGRIELVNAQTEKVFGYAREELMGQQVEMLMPRQFQDVHVEHRKQYSEDPHARSMGAGLELYGRRKDGSEFPVEVSLSPLKTLKGKLILSAVRDITERKHLDEALKASEERLQMAVEAAQLGVWDLDLATDRAFRSLRHDQIFGFETLQPDWGAEIATTHVIPEDREAFTSSFAEAFKTDRFLMECRINRERDHELRWISAQGRVYRNREGKPARLMGIVADVTERKKGEEEKELRRQELSRSNAELAAANRELESFSYSVSHDLRTPLRTIDGFSQVLLEDCAGQLDEAAKSHLKRIRAATQRMGALIDDLLNLSRISRTEMHMQTVDMSELVRSITGELQKSNPERCVDLQIEDGLQTLADSGLVRIALENLLNNAWKFTCKRNVAHVEFGVMPHNGTPAYFVRDDGAGFDPAYAGRLFGAFQRLHSASEFEGTGVGLATVQRIVRRHRGRIWAESAVDRGATFYFTLSGSPS